MDFSFCFQILYADILGVPGYLVAVKMAKEESSKDQVDEMKMESAIMAQFKHPNVVGLIGQVSVCISLCVCNMYPSDIYIHACLCQRFLQKNNRNINIGHKDKERYAIHVINNNVGKQDKQYLKLQFIYAWQ